MISNSSSSGLDAFNFIDIHYHANPDLYHRRHSTIDTGKKYQQLKGAVVLKSHLGSTSIQASIAQQEGLPVFPSLVLNHVAGGIHMRTVLQALAEYQPVIPSKLIVHLPTITGRNHKSKLSRQMIRPELEKWLNAPETIFDSKQQLSSTIIDLLKLSKDYPIVLSTGHASKEEIFALTFACDKWQVPMLLLNQPANPLTGLDAEELQTLTDRFPFVWVEQTSLTYLLAYQEESDFSKVLKELPRVIYSSDLGQTSQMDILEWINSSKTWFDKFNLSQERRKEICLTNPLQLLKL